jgi:D,D-heptose 1,7-bisphosphate phosphatase
MPYPSQRYFTLVANPNNQLPKLKAIILAGGKGTRLGKLTEEIPKPMLKLVGKPLMEYHMGLLQKYGITEIFITVNYLKDSIIEHFGNGEKFGVSIEYFEEKEPLGTVGGVKGLEDKLSEDFLVIYGDVMVEMDLKKLIDFHKIKKSAATLVLHPNDHPYDSDLVAVDKNDRVTAFIPKPHDDGRYHANIVNAGVYLLNKKVLQFIEPNKKADFGADIFPTLINQLPFYGYNTPEYMKDMGTPDRMVKVEEAILSGKVFRRNLEQKQKAIFLDRDGVINDDTEFIKSPKEMKLLPGVSSAIEQINKSEYLAIVATNQSVIARNLCTEEGLHAIHSKMETDLGKDRAYLDKIYYCPHHPDKGFPEENAIFKVDCDCRKPKPGMLLQAAEKYNIELSESYMIGDHERDIQAGKAAGAITVGVGTGKGFKKTATKSDYFFPDLKEAVNFIITEPHKNTANIVLETINKSAKSPFVITIGGNSQSGKTTFAAYLKQYLIQQGKHVLKIDLDDWILPKDRRKSSHDVMHNFQQDKLTGDLKRIMKGGMIELEGYSKIHGNKAIPSSYLIKMENVIIVEGVIGLALPYLLEIADLKIFTSIGTDEHKERILRYFKWKGYTEEESIQRYNERKELEYDLISATAKNADLTI